MRPRCGPWGGRAGSSHLLGVARAVPGCTSRAVECCAASRPLHTATEPDISFTGLPATYGGRRREDSEREDSRRLPVDLFPPPLLINRSAASVEEEGRDLQTPGVAREVKRRPAISISAVDRHPSIKVRRAQGHVTFARRLKQPVLVDLAASLTQRKSAEATSVRHHVQTRGLLQRNDLKVSNLRWFLAS